MADKRLHAVIYGHVQGVFFRSQTRQEAIALGLTGWVRNNNDGTVEVVAEGEERNIHELLDWCSTGPTAADVEKVDSKVSDATGEFDSFEIKY